MGVTVAAEVVVAEDLEVVAEDLEDLEMTAVEAVMEAVGASEERDQATPGLETGSVTLRTAATRTSPGGTSATSARLPSQRGPETAEEVRYFIALSFIYSFLMGGFTSQDTLRLALYPI